MLDGVVQQIDEHLSDLRRIDGHTVRLVCLRGCTRNQLKRELLILREHDHRLHDGVNYYTKIDPLQLQTEFLLECRNERIRCQYPSN
jgi:hypothetical protein